ncbi:ribonuclease P protein component 1 [Halostella litorea]|uniref:ribonuclease P protein component 1 n=1 Tax=Halostella litorea TaxID=2528831 RepID=UPI001092FB30|nr:ribonuclease P protein component 1 [Halostella litorea]
MALTPETLPRHELNGLRVEVVDAPNPDLVGIAGRVVIETMQTLHVECRPSETDGEEPRVCQVPKRDTTFEFALDVGADATDEAAAPERDAGTASKLGSETAGESPGQSGSGEGVAYVTVDGTRLLSRPAQRSENTGDSLWR